MTELTPGVSTSPRNNINTGLGGTYEVGAAYTSGGADYTAGGNAEGSRDNGYYVNGVNANENYESGSSFQPSAEAIGEVKVGVADFSAEYGRDFTNLNATTKSGTNTFHGEVYDFFENDALNALVPINQAQGLFTKNAYRFNQFGGGLGGPIYIPKILNLKDRAFFFVNYERNPHSLDRAEQPGDRSERLAACRELRRRLHRPDQCGHLRYYGRRSYVWTVFQPGWAALQPLHWQSDILQ